MSENSMVKLEYKNGNEGLGVIIDDSIYTCCHILPFFVGCLDFSPEVSIEHVATGKKYTQFFKYASSLDVAIVGMEPLFVDYDDHPAMEAAELYEEYGQLTKIYRAIETQSTTEEKGYFYAADGKSRINCTFTLQKTLSLWINCDEVRKGCSGGPLFNSRDQVIGIVVGGMTGGETWIKTRVIRLEYALPGLFIRQK